MYIRKIIILFYCAMAVWSIHAQTAQKPSANYTHEQTALKTNISHLTVIKTKDDFNKLARIYNKGTVSEIPHLLFAVDLNEKDKVYYINTPKYEFHLYFFNDFFNKNYVPQDIVHNYTDSTRRFVLGTVSYQKLISQYTYELWEGDKITSSLLKHTDNLLKATFFAKLQFKTNSTLHERTADQAGVQYITQEKIVKEYPYIALNTGTAKGRIRIANSIDELSNIGEYDILVLKEVPLYIPSVAGVITERASTLLSHVNVLARGLGIPSIYIYDVAKKMKEYNGQFVELKATSDDYKIKVIPEPKYIPSKKNKYFIKSDLRRMHLIPLDDMRAGEYIYCGMKAANLGEIKAKMKNVNVPDGFSIPFAQYHDFMKQNALYESFDAIQNKPGFKESSDVRKKELAKFRSEIEEAPLKKELSEKWIKQWHSQLGGRGVFVRSSSNAEDLKNFSGAGLFTTVPNVRNARQLEDAVKKVWASVYNFEAYESRRQAGIPDSLIMMSVFVQLAIDSEVSGVMITKDPYNSLRQGITYIAAKRGIGIKVVEGERIAEQVMYSERTNAVQLISRSDENTELRLDPKGGVKEVATVRSERVMTDELVVDLAAQGRRVKQLFKTDMDIEWAVSKGQIIILQARPYK